VRAAYHDCELRIFNAESPSSHTLVVLPIPEDKYTSSFGLGETGTLKPLDRAPPGITDTGAGPLFTPEFTKVLSI
jgi:hypothetical protein